MFDDIIERVNLARRRFMLRAGAGIGALAAAELLGSNRGVGAVSDGASAVQPNTGVLGTGQFPARAKRVIQLHMLGAISHVDCFDYKPTLVNMHGQPMPESVLKTQRLSTMSAGQSVFPLVAPL